MRAAIALLAAVPSLALAQVGALDAAREAGAKQQAGTARHQAAADAALGDPAAPPHAAGEPDPATALEKEVGPLPGTDPSAVAQPAGEAHTVQRGDTLWDLSAKYLQDPYSWPKIWSWNPGIANPHWIYPGNVVRLGPGAKGELAQQAPAEAAAADDSDAPQAPRELPGFSSGNIDRSELGEGDEVQISGNRRIGVVGSHGAKLRRDSFITGGELAEAGVISAAFEDKLLLTVLDRAYAKFLKPEAVKVGATYAIFKTERELVHPLTKRSFGFKTTILGAARVLSVDGKAVTLQITSASEAIERGDYLGLFPDRLAGDVEQRANQKSVNGVIVGADVEVLSELAEHHYVYVDRGTVDGVEAGNTFTVVRSGDPYGRDMTLARADSRLPDESIGQLLVVEAKEHASTALVVKSLRELLIGDRVEMRVAAAKGNASR